MLEGECRAGLYGYRWWRMRVNGQDEALGGRQRWCDGVFQVCQPQTRIVPRRLFIFLGQRVW